jgi:L-ascorbate metabolism protein UlaG (beta-lactamase superfamily)
MNILKLGHCCLVIEVSGLRILTDPGAWTTAQNDVKNINVILITHEHADHIHIESLKKVIANNPNAVIYTNTGVSTLLSSEGIEYQLLEKDQTTSVKEVSLEVFDCAHEPIYKTIPLPQNTGYFIGERLWYPGDSFGKFVKPIEILALPVAGPWMHISEALDYAKHMKPKHCFPVHDGMLKIFGPFHALPEKVLAETGINFIPLEPGQEKVFD